MNDHYRLGHVLGRAWRLARGVVTLAALAALAWGMYAGSTAYFETVPRIALSGSK